MNTEPTSMTTTELYVGCSFALPLDLQVSNGAVPIYSKEEDDWGMCHSRLMLGRSVMFAMYDRLTKMCNVYGVVPVELTPIPVSWKLPDGWRTQLWRSIEPCRGGDENKAKGIYTLTTGESFQVIQISNQDIKFKPIV
ncbi:hypothetical protein CAEBREN_07431 [Caenorhabditis brenneri]|uniref:Uncharacterized protein n=1 Tax=Caenorhabditis brenneri TaxID=135651 RepID=G0NL75_CAEBE|nr:hypothetical protein CAEBREN_07431 [Caenorhabditis brenneri]